MDLFSFYADNQLIKKATSPDETPTPGYVYHEIVGLTHKSVEACQNLENQLVSRLDNDSPIVKLKALRTIKHILLKGHMSVKRDMMGRVAAIRPCIHARGAPDPLRGDALWQSVRTEAQEVLNVIFDTEQRAAAPPVAVSSISSDNFSSSNYSSGSGSGYGSSSGSSTPYGYGTPGVGLNSSAGSGFASTGSSISRPKPLFESGNAIAGEVKNKLSSLVAPKPTNELSNFGSLSTVSHHAATSHTHAGALDWGTAHHAQPAQSSGEEERLVDEITNPTGASAALSFQALDQFVARSSLLDQLFIVELLFKKLEARAWQSRQKALAALEALLLSPSAGEAIKSYCAENSTVIHNLVSSVHHSTREKAKQVLALLGVRLDIPERETSRQPHATATTSLVAPDSPSSPASERAAPPIISSLFAGLSVSDAPTSVPTPTPAPIPTPAPAPTPTPVSAPTPTPTPAPPPKPLIDFGDEPEHAPATNTNSTSMFSFLEVKAPPSPSPAPSSNHVLIHSSPSNDFESLTSSSPAVPPTSAPAPLLDLFDTPHEHSSSDAPLVASSHTNGNHGLIDFSDSHTYTPPSATSSSTSLLAMLSSGTLSGPAPSSTNPSTPSQPTPSFLSDLLETTPANTSLGLLVGADGRSLLSAAPPTAPSKPPMSAYKPAPQAPRSTTIVTTSATSVYAPLTHIPRAAPTLIPSGAPSSPSPSSSSSSSSSFGFVETKKQDSLSELWSQQKTQMKSK